MISWMDARVIGSRRTGPFPVSHPRVETWKRMETKMETKPFPPMRRRKHAPAGVETKLRGIGFRVSFRLLANPSRSRSH